MILSVVPISVTVSFYFAKVGISPTALHPNMNGGINTTPLHLPLPSPNTKGAGYMGWGSLNWLIPLAMDCGGWKYYLVTASKFQSLNSMIWIF